MSVCVVLCKPLAFAVKLKQIKVIFFSLVIKKNLMPPGLN